MATYTKRTCYNCGIRKSQPEMLRKSISKVTSTYQRSLSGREVVGAVLGEKSSRRSVGNWLWAPNKRSRTSHRDVWVCAACEKDFSNSVSKSLSSQSPSGDSVIGLSMLVGIVIVLFMAFANEPSSDDRTSAVPRPTETTATESPSAPLTSTNAPETTSEPSFVIQIAAFSELDNANNSQNTLRGLGLTSRQEQVTVNGREIWRVLVIGNSQQDPDTVLRLLNENGFSDAFVRPNNN